MSNALTFLSVYVVSAWAGNDAGKAAATAALDEFVASMAKDAERASALSELLEACRNLTFEGAVASAIREEIERKLAAVTDVLAPGRNVA
jgi:hypothetical protein